METKIKPVLLVHQTFNGKTSITEHPLVLTEVNELEAPVLAFGMGTIIRQYQNETWSNLEQPPTLTVFGDIRVETLTGTTQYLQVGQEIYTKGDPHWAIGAGGIFLTMNYEGPVWNIRDWNQVIAELDQHYDHRLILESITHHNPLVFKS